MCLWGSTGQHSVVQGGPGKAKGRVCTCAFLVWGLGWGVRGSVGAGLEISVPHCIAAAAEGTACTSGTAQCCCCYCLVLLLLCAYPGARCLALSTCTLGRRPCQAVSLKGTDWANSGVSTQQGIDDHWGRELFSNLVQGCTKCCSQLTSSACRPSNWKAC